MNPTPLARRCFPRVLWFGLALLILGSVEGLGRAQAAPPQTGARISREKEIVFPESPWVINVRKAPYHARGDGVTDDTEAIQKALSDIMGQHKILYFPEGTYLVSKTLNWSNKNSQGKPAWGKNYLQGQRVDRVTIKLKDGVFTDPKQPQSIMWCGGFGSADWFHNCIQDMTFDVGRNNPGATALQFYSNNTGAVRHCRFLAAPESGVTGLDLIHRDMNGPLLVRDCEVVGFRRGIHCGRAVNSQTFERITLIGQRETGFVNEGQSISIRGLLCEGEVPAVQTYGHLCLIEARLVGKGNASRVPGIVNFNGGRIHLRDIATSGYARAVGDVLTPDSAQAFRIVGPDKPGSLGPDVAEYFSHTQTRAFPGEGGSLRLPIEDPPETPIDPLSAWANVDDFGADPTGQKDSSVAIQKAVDSGATTIFLPGTYLLEKTVIIRGKVHRLVGCGSNIDYFSRVKPDFRVTDGNGSPLVFEHFANIHGGIEIDSARTLLFRSVSDARVRFTPKAWGGKIFAEDFCTDDLRISGQTLWARQLNVENEGTHLTNDGGKVWVLGYKTERGGTLLHTKKGGKSEILGGFSYTTTAGKLAPMFVTEDASVFAFFGEVCYNGDPFTTLIREMRQGQTKTIERGAGGTSPYVGHAGGR